MIPHLNIVTMTEWAVGVTSLPVLLDASCHVYFATVKLFLSKFKHTNGLRHV